MDEAIQAALDGAEAYLVGGVVRDRLLGRPALDVDVACPAPQRAARAFLEQEGGALFPLSERHGAWRVAFRDGRTVDFTPLGDSIEANLATRDFTVNAIALPLAGGEPVDPFGGRADLEARRLRAVSARVFADDPLRLLRAVRLEEELALRLDRESEELVRAYVVRVGEPAGERILGELRRLSPRGLRRLAELGLLVPLGGSLELLERVGDAADNELALVAVFGRALERLPIPNELRRYAHTLLVAEPPGDASPRAIFRFRRATEPWALDALAYLGVDGELATAVQAARRDQPAEPLLRGDELGLPAGPRVGELLELIAEERAAGTISTREEALAFVRHAT